MSETWSELYADICSPEIWEGDISIEEYWEFCDSMLSEYIDAVWEIGQELTMDRFGILHGVEAENFIKELERNN